jgi:septum formation protein
VRRRELLNPLRVGITAPDPVGSGAVRVVLASASPARLSVLRAAGLDPHVEVADLDERALLETMPHAAAGEQVTALASAKAATVARRIAGTHPDAVLIGCDSMLLLDGELVGKPADRVEVRRRWRAMAGRTGELITGHAVLRTVDGEIDRVAEGYIDTTVRFARPTDDELDAYIGSGEPLAVAGAFTLDGLGGWFVDGIVGDPSNVIGISLPLTRRLLAEVGVTIADLWVR